MRKLITAAVAASLLLAGGLAAGAAFAPRPASSTATAGPVLYGCITHTKRLILVGKSVPACPAGDRGISWQGLPFPTRTPTPTPSATSPTPTPAPATPTPTPTPSATSPTPTPAPSVTWAWCSTSTGAFFPTPDGRYGIWTGEWGSSLPQQVCANSQNGWQATFSAPAGNTGILTYPDVQLNYNSSQPAISGLNPAATVSFSENMNPNPGTSAEAGFDIWVTGTGCNRCEVMIWTDTVNRGTVGGARFDNVTASFCGQSWQLWQFGSELIWYLPSNERAGTVCPAAMLQDLQSIGKLPANAALSQFEDGWEIASTGGQHETFQWTGYSVNGLPRGN